MIKPQFPSGYTVWIDGVEVPKDDVLDVEFEDCLDILDKLAVTIRNDRMKYTKEHNRLRGASIRVQAGWIGKEWASIFTGKIFRSRPKFADEFTIEIAATPISITDGWHEEKTAEHEGETISEIIKNIVQNSSHPRLGFIEEVSKRTRLSKPLIQDRETDWEFCQRIARLAGGKEFTIKNGVAILRDSKPTGSPTVVFEYGVNVLSLEAIESDLDLASQSGVAHEPDENSVVVESSQVKILDLMIRDEYKAFSIDRINDTGSPPNYVEFKPDADSELAEIEAAGIGKESASGEIKLSIKAIGTIRAVAGKTCIVKGYGYLDGKYYMRRVVHRFKSDYQIAVEVSNKQTASSGEQPETEETE